MVLLREDTVGPWEAERLRTNRISVPIFCGWNSTNACMDLTPKNGHVGYTALPFWRSCRSYCIGLT